LETLISWLVQFRSKSRKRTWVSGSSAWLNRTYPGWRKYEKKPKSLALKLVRFLWKKYDYSNCTSSKSAEDYHKYNLSSSAPWVKFVPCSINLTTGVTALSKIRTGSFWTAKRLARIGYLPRRYISECPFCGMKNGGEDLVHFFLNCSAWQEERSIIWNDFERAKSLNNGATLHCLVMYMAGGHRLKKNNNWIRINDDGLMKVKDRSNDLESFVDNRLGCIPGCYSGREDIVECSCIRVIRFLQYASKKRYKMLKTLFSASCNWNPPKGRCPEG